MSTQPPLHEAHKATNAEFFQIAANSADTLHAGMESLWRFPSAPLDVFPIVSRNRLQNSDVATTLGHVRQETRILLARVAVGLQTGEVSITPKHGAIIAGHAPIETDATAETQDHAGFAVDVAEIAGEITSEQKDRYRRIKLSTAIGAFSQLSIAYEIYPGSTEGNLAPRATFNISESRDINIRRIPLGIRKLVQRLTKRQVEITSEYLSDYNLMTVDVAGLRGMADTRQVGRPDLATSNVEVFARTAQTANRLHRIAKQVSKISAKLPPELFKKAAGKEVAPSN